ncbi:alpha/beta fold hydrolase [Pseudoponticoccus marisrubri]|uniref:Alpha/beta hydrolase n=1 Tax=Pseudoponticoccus marisrubri TaxID=1685382 RepID=A0A0W7WMB0_9RHOB|nr:alpha/beta fold hydrolase [Pseudoponticoccus marisrubri]KUF11737.1 alpha/beta hydrolase [Pseudoponticoccus marisrubri]
MVVNLGIGLAVAAPASGGVALDLRASRAERAAEDRWPAKGQFVEIAGTRVHYVQAGDGPDVVLLHGAGGNLRDFTYGLTDALTQHYRVTAFDRPGLGYTGRASEAYGGAFNPRAESPQVQAALLAGAAQAIGLKRPVVVGHSFGGAVAMAWALEHEAAAVVSLAGAIMPWPGGLDAQYRLIGSRLGGALVPPAVTALTDPMSTAETVGRIFAPQAVPEGYLAHVGPGLTLRRATLRANGRQVNVLRPALEQMSTRYDTLDLPVELLHGTADTIVGLDIHSRGAAALLPDAALTVLEDVGHMPHHARPGAALEAIHRAARRAGLR